MVPVVAVENVSKYFAVGRRLAPFVTTKKHWALLEVSFSVEPGQILGVVGPNGAGKTTLLRIVADLLEADHGSTRICGQKLNKSTRSLRGKIGYVSSDERSFFWRLSGRQNLEFFSHLYGVPKMQAHKKIRTMLELFGLEGEAEQFFRDYSTGTRKKFALIRALLHEPELLLLDEVTNSLDPASAESVKSLVREYTSSRPGRASIWSTHRLEEIDELCDKVLAINKGRAEFFGCPDKLESTSGRKGGHLPDELNRTGGENYSARSTDFDGGTKPSAVSVDAQTIVCHQSD